MNTQGIEPKFNDVDGALQIHSIWLTIQGEGPFVGERAVFIRLAGCNLQCPLCDTDYTSERKLIYPDDLAKQVEVLAPDGLVVLTGGEPMRQNLGPFISVLPGRYLVQIETNGTIYLPTVNYSKSFVVCSPKAKKIHPELTVDFYKYVLRAGEIDPADGLPTAVLGYNHSPARPAEGTTPGRVYIQPCDDLDPIQNDANVKACVESVMRFGYKLSLQTHKIIGVK